VTLGLCSQLELDLAVERASHRREKLMGKAVKKGETLKPIEEPTPKIAEEDVVHASDSSDR